MLDLHWQSRWCGDSSHHACGVAQNDIIFRLCVLVVTLCVTKSYVILNVVKNLPRWFYIGSHVGAEILRTRYAWLRMTNLFVLRFIVTLCGTLLHGRGAPLPYKAIFTHILVKFSAYAKSERKEIHPRPQAFHIFTCEANFTNPERDLFRLSSGGRPMVAPTVWRRSQQKRYCGQT